MHVTIQGGTHAGWRAVKERPPSTHGCAAANGASVCANVHATVTLAGHLYSCPACGARRP